MAKILFGKYSVQRLEIQNTLYVSKVSQHRYRDITIYSSVIISDNVGSQNGPVIGTEKQNLYDTGMNISGQIPASDSSNTRSRANFSNLLELEAHDDRRPFFEVPAPHFDTYHFLLRAMFSLSNNLIISEWSHKEREELLETLFSRISTRTLLTLLNNDLPTIRAAWEALIDLSYLHKWRNAFSQLIDVGLKRKDWINPKKHEFLSIAASFGSLDVVQKLLNIGARPDHPVDDTYLDVAISRAVHARSLSCARVLIQNCDVNRIINERERRSNFVVFLRSNYIPTGIKDEVPNIHLDIRVQDEVLRMFLDAGADVDSIQEVYEYSQLLAFHRKNRVPQMWRPTILEQCLYERQILFKTLVHYSRRASTEITRAGICLAAEQGRRRLGQYLDERPGQNSLERKAFLELILAEQFTDSRYDINTKLVLSLIDFGVDIHLPFLRMMGVRTNVSKIMYRVVVEAARDDSDLPTATLLSLLLTQGAIIDETIIQRAVANKGLGTLPFLAQLGADIKNLGGQALVTAARSNNWEAVSWLLGAGIDVNAGISFRGERRTVISLVNDKGCRLHNWAALSKCSGASWEMIQYLLCCGAKLRSNPDETHPFTFLRESIQASCRDDDLLAKTRLYLDCEINLRDPAGSNALLLEACLESVLEEKRHQPLATFELLFQRGAPVTPGSALALLIYNGGRHGLIEDVLDAGADIHSHFGHGLGVCLSPLQAAAGRGDQELVSMLLSRGADINQPAADICGKTALQAACEWNALFAEENSRRRNLISYLIEQGADVTAPASERYGLTALQAAAMKGDIELASLLLDRGADPNEPPSEFVGYAALDGAAWMGRLDMVQFLLTVGALSHRRGRSGYAGAIRLAEKQGYTTVADLLRRHAADVNGIFETAPMSTGQEDDGEVRSDDSYDSGGESSSSGNDYSEEWWSD